MKRYKVLKEFVDRNGKVRRPKDKVELEVHDAKFMSHEYAIFYSKLALAGYIEELKEAGLWSRGIEIPRDSDIQVLFSSGNICHSPHYIPCAVNLGQAFRTRAEAKSYAEYLKLENELINIAVQEYNAKIKHDGISHKYCAYSAEDNCRFYFYDAFFSAYGDAVLFGVMNRDKMRLWASYFMEKNNA